MEKRRSINSLILFTTAFFVLLSVFVMKIVNTMMGYKSNINSYYLRADYKSSEDLFSTLLSYPNRLFLWCCDCIQFYAVRMGITYEQLNIDLFVILQPMLIVMFAVLFVIQSVRLSRSYNLGQSNHN